MTAMTALRTIALAGVSLSAALGTAPAFGQQALDAEAFLSRFEGFYNANGYVLDFAPGSLDGDTVVSPALKAGLAGIEGTVRIEGPFTFEGVVANDDGSYSVETLSVADLSFDVGTAEDPGKVEVRNISLAGLKVPASDTPPIAEMIDLVARMEAGPLVVTRGEDEIAEVGSFLWRTERDAADAALIKTEVVLDDINADLSGVDDAEARPVIDALGLNTIAGRIVQTGTWNMETGAMTLDDMSLDFNDIGKLGMRLEFAGFTQELFNTIQEQSRQIQALTEAGDATALEQANAALGVTVLSQVSIGNASVRYDDAGIMPKVIAYIAEQESKTPEELIASWEAQLTELIKLPGAEALAAEINGAIATFLADPQSLEASIAPAQPILLLQFAAMAMAPQMLVQQLGFSATANTPAAER